MKKLVLSTIAVALFASAISAQTPAKAATKGNANGSAPKVQLKTNKPASIPAESVPAAKVDAPKVEMPQANVPTTDVPKAESTPPNISKMEAPKVGTPKVDVPAVNPMGDLGALGKNIATELGTKLLLNQMQGTKVGQLVTTFLTAKSAILPLLKTDPMGFSSKLSGAQGDLMGGLKTVLSAQQMTNFMGLKPKTNDATNVLSNLFF
jgi:hypothetical protein